jgi:hypothetical protein
MDNAEDDNKFKALETSVYCPPYKEENAIETISLEGEFDVEKAKDGVRRSVSLLSYQRSYRPMIIEILDVLDQNTAHFLVDKQNCITFYWSGILVLKIDITNEDASHGKQLHVSLQKYKVEKERLDEKTKLDEERAKLYAEKIEKEQMNNNMLFFGLGGSIAIAGLVTAYALLKKK